jgi:molybdopterin-guanine dinucleotide biosynthesis protein A
VLPAARARIDRGDLSLHGLAEEVDAEILPEEIWRAIDPSGNSFANLNTIEEYAANRERA